MSIQSGESVELIYMYGLFWTEISRDIANSISSYNTTLPGSPVDGQEAILVDSVTNPTYVWRLRYNAGSASAYKWEFIGGTDYYAVANVGAYAAIPNGFSAQPPVFISPTHAGDWDTSCGVQITTSTVPNYAVLGTGTTSVNALNDANTLSTANGHMTMSVSNVLPSVPANQQISLWIAGSGAMSVANMWLRVRPRRIS